MRTLVLDEESAVYKIFHYPFHCIIPFYATISYDALERYGNYEDQEYESSPYSPVDKILTINEMIELYKQGTQIQLSKPIESKKIYNVILEHLEMWRDYGIYFGAPYNPPLEDLCVMNELAKNVYRLAINHGDMKEEETDLFELMNGVVPLTEGEIINSNNFPNVFNEIEQLVDRLGGYEKYGY